MILFYTLAFVILVSCVFLITNKNPVYSVLSLVCLFVCGSLLLLILEADFLAFVFIIVYAGAVAVLFLFVVIILDIKQYKSSLYFQKIPYALLAFILFSFIFYLSHFLTKDYMSLHNAPYDYYFTPSFWEVIDTDSSINALGQILYNEYAIHFVLSGLVLLVAIIGAIVLTRRVNKTSHTQKTLKQTERSACIGLYKKI